MQLLGQKMFADKLNLYVVGDTHYGTEAFARHRFEAYVEKMAKDPHARWIGIGDYIEAIGITDKRFDPGSLDAEMRAQDLKDLYGWQIDGLLSILAPVRKKCLALLRGNHEDVALNRTGSSAWWNKFVDTLGAPDCGTSCMIDLVVGSRKVRVVAHHGAGGAATDGGRAQRLARFANMFVADLVITGHMHAKAETTIVRLAGNPACNKLISISTRAICCASWYRSYHGHGSYAERRGMPPAELGAPIVRITNDRLDVDWFLG